MRLSREQVEALVSTVRAHVSPEALCDLRLFGSRLHEGARGGDVDLYLEVRGLDPAAAAALQRRLRPLLEERLDLPVDLVVQRLEEPRSLVAEIAATEGVGLLGDPK